MRPPWEWVACHENCCQLMKTSTWRKISNVPETFLHGFVRYQHESCHENRKYTKIPMKHNGPMRGGGGLLPKSPPFDENFDLEGDKVCSREILPSSDTIETVTMPKNSKTHIYIEGIHPWMQLSQNRPRKVSNMTPLSHSGVQDYFNTTKLTVVDDHMATDPSVS